MDNKQVEQALENILRNPLFARAPRQSRLLRYIVERSLRGKRDELKEYTLALEVFDRPSTYDPQADSTVRVEVSKLRTRLAEYYAGEGAGEAVRIQIPKGGYVAEFVAAESAAEGQGALEEVAGGEAAPARSRRWWIGVAGAVAASSAAGTWVVSRARVRSAAKACAVLLAAEEAGRGGASGKALEALELLSRELRAEGVAVRGADEPGVRFRVTVRTGRGWGSGDGMWAVAEIRDVEREAALWSGVWPGRNGEFARQAAREVAGALHRLRERVEETAQRRGAIELYRQALVSIGEEKSFVMQTARERAGRTALGRLLRAASLLEQALRADPAFSEARAKLAWVYHLAAEYDASLQPKVRETAVSALTSGAPAEAHYVLAYQALFVDWNAAEARRHFGLCLERAAFHKDAARLHTDSACIQGEWDAARRRLEPLLSVEPRSPVLRAGAFLLADYSGDTAEMERLARETMQWEPEAALPRWQLGQAYRVQGRLREAEQQFRLGLERDPGSKRLLFALARLQLALGRKAEALRLAASCGLERSNPSLMAMLELDQGREKEALGWLERAVEQREVSLCYLALDPGVRQLRADAPISEFLRRLKIPAGRG